ncbi:MAG: hypothetical protein V7K32_03600 [Nostoc sp.]|uniref:hypothetical protein n=1 Tax=Nostoc sp. TaxID=1180 RepID=UPI002FF6B845
MLIDFGAVKQVQTQLLTLSGRTEATIAIGTPGYMSTEQEQGKPPAISRVLGSLRKCSTS